MTAKLLHPITLTEDEAEALLTLLEPSDPDVPETEVQRRLYDKVRAALETL